MEFCYGRTDLDVAGSFAEELSVVKGKLPKAAEPVVFSSPLQRCRKLAEGVFGPLRKIDERLVELNFGEWELKRWDDINREHLDNWFENFVDNASPGGESFASLSQRVGEFLEHVCASCKGRDVFVFTHGGVIRGFLARILEMPLENCFRMDIDFGSVSLIEHKQDFTCVKYINR